MAPWLVTAAIFSGKPIRVFNNGDMYRDFTYIDDIVDGVVQVMQRPPSGRNLHRLLNIGRGSPASLMDFIRAIESALGKNATKQFAAIQPGDVPRTFASTERFQFLTGYKPNVGVDEGVKQFVEWYVKSWLPYIRG